MARFCTVFYMIVFYGKAPVARFDVLRTESGCG